MFDKFMTSIWSQTDNTVSTNSTEVNKIGIDIYDHIQKIKSDPLGRISLYIFIGFAYVYFANNLMTLIIGLIYPLYNLYVAILTSNFEDDKNMMTIFALSKYFMLYGHIELIMKIIDLVSISMSCHIKILIYVVLHYLALYKPEQITKIYDRVILYDKIALQLIINLTHALYTKIAEEYANISRNTTDKTS